MSIDEELWKFSDIFFEEETHRYTDSYGTKYTSVTTKVHDFCPEQDWGEIARKYAVKNGRDVAEVKAEWERKKNIAADMGTQVHSYMENLWKRKHYRPENPIGDYEKKHKVGLMAYEKLRRRFVPVRNELIVYDREWAVCGTIDFLCWDKGKGCLAILDWKTNAKIDRENPYQTCIGPLRGMPDCNYTHYSAQLSLYKAIVERNTELRIGELALVHIGMDDWEYIPCIDRSVEIRVYLDEQRKKNANN